MHAMRFPVVHGDPVSVKLCRGVGGTRVERRSFALRDVSDSAVKFRSRSLVKACSPLHAENADRLEQPQGAEAIRIRGIFRRLKRHLNVALCGKIVDLVRLCLLHNADQVSRIGQIAVMKAEADITFVRVLIKMVDATSVE
jgi:hypothetical protein